MEFASCEQADGNSFTVGASKDLRRQAKFSSCKKGTPYGVPFVLVEIGRTPTHTYGVRMEFASCEQADGSCGTFLTEGATTMITLRASYE